MTSATSLGFPGNHATRSRRQLYLLQAVGGPDARNPRLVCEVVTSLQRMAGKHNRLYSSRFLAAINRHISVDGYGSLRIARDRRLSVVQGDTNWPY
jgi:hypothetical protein